MPSLADQLAVLLNIEVASSPAIPGFCHATKARIQDPLPAPSTCRYCGGHVSFTTNDVFYGRQFGEWPWCYFCSACKAYVGCHPKTDIPLGTLADGATRKARNAAHAAFDPLWRGKGSPMKREHAYQWLSEALGIPRSVTHIGFFDQQTCERVVNAVGARSATSA